MSNETQPPGSSVSRRDLLRGGLALGLFGLAGCKSGGESAIPGPVQATGPKASPTLAAPAAAQPIVGSTTVMPRALWTKVAGPVRTNHHPMGGVERITVHHEGSTAFTATDVATVARRIESVRLAHLNRRTKGEPWVDIGYHYIIDPAGRIWEGRDVNIRGAHVEDFNEHNLGIMCLGNFEIQSPTPQQLATLQRFVRDQMNRYRVPVARVLTHRECPGARTACPGRNLQQPMLAYRARGGAFA